MSGLSMLRLLWGYNVFCSVMLLLMGFATHDPFARGLSGFSVFVAALFWLGALMAVGRWLSTSPMGTRMAWQVAWGTGFCGLELFLLALSPGNGSMMGLVVLVMVGAMYPGPAMRERLEKQSLARG